MSRLHENYSIFCGLRQSAEGQFPALCRGRGCERCRKRASASQQPCRVHRPQAVNRVGSFSSAARPRVASLAPAGQFTFCTSKKIPIRLQVQRRSAVRSATAEGFFRQFRASEMCSLARRMLRSSVPRPQCGTRTGRTAPAGQRRGRNGRTRRTHPPSGRGWDASRPAGRPLRHPDRR